MNREINKFYLVKYILKLIVNLILLPLYLPIYIMGLLFISIISFANSDTFEDFTKDVKYNICDFPLDVVKAFYLPDTDFLYI